MRRFLRRPSPAMLVAIAALVWATCGSAIADGVNAVASALKPNSVNSKTIKNGSVGLNDLSKSVRKALTRTGATGGVGPAGPQGAQGPAGTPNGYTKTEADGAFLGKTAKAADSDKLDGIDSSGFVQGGGVQDDSYVLLNPNGSSDPLLKIPGLGKLTASCSAVPDASATYVNDSGGTVNYSSTLITVGGNFFQASPINDGVSFGSGTTPGMWILQLQKGSLFAGSSRATVLVSRGILNGKCRIQAQLQGSSTSGFTLGVPPVILGP